MSYRTRNILILLTVFLALMGLDLYFLIHDGTENTFSASIYSFAREYPITVAFIFMIVGHLLWPLAKDTMKGQASVENGLAKSTLDYARETREAVAQNHPEFFENHFHDFYHEYLNAGDMPHIAARKASKKKPIYRAIRKILR